jgi:hypothetical protein
MIRCPRGPGTIDLERYDRAGPLEETAKNCISVAESSDLGMFFQTAKWVREKFVQIVGVKGEVILRRSHLLYFVFLTRLLFEFFYTWHSLICTILLPLAITTFLRWRF